MTDAEKTFLEKNKMNEEVIYNTLTSKKRTYEQKVLDLAHCAENMLNVLNIPERTLHYFSIGAINDLFEGHAPYRPRYVMVDFEKFMKQGSKFLRLNSPKNLDEADLIIDSSDNLRLLSKSGDLSAITSVYGELVPDKLKDKEGMWFGVFYDPAVILINQTFSRRVGQGAITHWHDLSNKDGYRIIMENLTDTESTQKFLACMSSQMGQDEFLNYFKTIRNSVQQYAKFPITPVRMTAVGDADIAITRRSYVFKFLQDDFPAYIIIPEEGSPVNLYGCGVKSSSQYKNEAVKFLNWLLSDAAARNVILTQKTGYLSVLPKGGNGSAVDDRIVWINSFYETKEDIEKLSHVWLQQVRVSNGAEGKDETRIN